MQSDELEKVSLVGVLLLLVAVLIVLLVPPAKQYEISLYDTYPIYFWGLIIGAMFLGAMVVVGSATNPEDGTWMFGLALMVVTNALVLLLPFIRGYRMYGRGDALTHIGFVRDIINVGAIEHNIYPPTHLLVTVVADATGLDVTTVAMAIPVVFSGMYFGAMFYLLVFLFDSRERVLFGVPFVMLPVLGFAHVHLRPFDMSIMLVPLVLYLFIKGRRESAVPVRAMFVVALIANLLYHPLTALFMLIVLSLYFVARHLPEVKKQYGTPTNVVSLSTVVVIAWYTTEFIRRSINLYRSLFGISEGQAPIETFTETTEKATIALIDIVRVFTFRFGTEFLLFGLGFAFLGVALLLYNRGKYTPTTYTVMLGGILVTFVVGGVVVLVSDLVTIDAFDRSFQIAKLGGVVLAGQLFYLMWKHGNWSPHRGGLPTGLVTLFGVVLLLLIAVSTFSLYPSPLSSGFNHQVTDMELQGTVWVTEHGTNNTGMREHGMSYNRHHNAQYGKLVPPPYEPANVPDHFTYETNESVGQSYEEDQYLIITRRGRILYPEIFPDYRENWRLTPGDFSRLERDTTAARIYDNGDFDLYRVQGQAEGDPAEEPLNG